MHFDSVRDGVGIDLTPFVTAVNTAADSYAKIEAARAARKAAGVRPQAPQQVMQAPTGASTVATHSVRPQAPQQVMQAPARRRNPMSYLLLGAVAIGGFFIVRRMMSKRRR